MGAPGNRLRLRRAEPRDAAALTACIAAAYSVYAGRVRDLPPVSEGVAEEIGANLVWVAEVGGRIAGGIMLVPRDGFLQLANVAVAPESAGQGIGRALIALAEAECRKLGLTEMRLTTHVDMPGNVRRYERLGWVETARTGNKVHMSKRLPGG